MNDKESTTPAGTAGPVDPFNPDDCRSPAIMTGGSIPAGEKADVKLLVFDMGHVFVDFDWEVVCKGFYDRSGHSRDDFRGVLAYIGSLGYERGQIGTDAFLDELNKKLGITLSLDEFKALWNATFVENAEMAALLQSLKARYPLYLLSNTNEVHYRHLQDSFDVARHFNELILSYEVGCSKPDPEIYQIVIERSGLLPGQCVFIDDLARNVDAARAIGMHAIQFVGIDDLRARLADLGVSV